MKTFLGFTWVGWLNILLLQWMFIRLAYVVEVNNNMALMKDARIIYFIVPCTGWWSRFKYVGRKKVCHLRFP